MDSPKRFYTYEQQIEHLKSKDLIIDDESKAVEYLKQYSYYACVSAYKDIFKVSRNGNYKHGIRFNHIRMLYMLDRALRDIFLHHIMLVETQIKSLYSYAFCDLVGDRQKDYLNANNYNYAVYQASVNKFLAIVQEELRLPKSEYVRYNLKTYGEVPPWVLIHVLTFGNISHMYTFSLQRVQNRVAKDIGVREVFRKQLLSMLPVLTDFRNVCAHGERLYSYKTRKMIDDMPAHEVLNLSKKGDTYSCGKNDLFAVMICLRYLLPMVEFRAFTIGLSRLLDSHFEALPAEIVMDVKKSMGFPENWHNIIY
ncbi:MAG: Abi family protein [Oscillospiraceae bacterium]|nr:Abi family protein [Oscillospiraceae bacterium]